jgi:glycopeptide antibiotics resistance protein
MTNSATEPERASALTIVLFTAYALLLVGLILFKFPFDYGIQTIHREVNLIPFAGSVTKNGSFSYSEVIQNVLAFVPLGIYLGMLRPQWSWWLRLLVIVATTVIFETIQYSFAIGRADITDVFGNTLGGIIGIGIYAAVARGLRSRTNWVMNIICLVLTVLVVLFAVYLALHSFVRVR